MFCTSKIELYLEISIDLHFCKVNAYFVLPRWGNAHAKEVEMTMKGQEDSIPLTENDQMASWKKTIENMTELLKILSDKDNWDLGARDETRYLHEKKQHFNNCICCFL